MSIFDRLDRMTSQAIDRVYSSAFTCTPMVSAPNGRSSPDPDREAWDGAGILTENPVDAPIDVGARNRSNDLRTLVKGHGFDLSVDRVRYPGADTVRQRDRFTIGERTFDVVDVRRDGLSRVVFGVAER
ncbi:hypothetical protein [Ancylobacter terrae]|uniref:hypothetical protein n=1 Tax=Ancylobacter sp. sgz301288 TaxID=3342077 RepID=UPI00385C1AC9